MTIDRSGEGLLIMHLPFDLPRLRFRVFAAGDSVAFHAYRSDPDVARYQGWSPMTLAAAKQFVNEQAQVTRLAPGAWTQLVIAGREDDALVGDLGIWLSDDRSEAEFGLTLSPELQGRGLGTEAVRGIIGFLAAATPVAIVTAASDVRNTPCLRALRSAGMRLETTRQAEYKGESCMEEVYCWRRPQDVSG